MSLSDKEFLRDEAIPSRTSGWLYRHRPVAATDATTRGRLLRDRRPGATSAARLWLRYADGWGRA
jgi:hypothetical protein